jgi:hypothetical protein
MGYYCESCEGCIKWEQLNEYTGICQGTTQVEKLDNEAIKLILSDDDDIDFKILTLGIVLTKYSWSCRHYQPQSKKVECHHFSDPLKK